MPTYVAFLRAVNVGGRNTVSMKGLVQDLLAEGFQNVSTYLNSGNVILASDLDEQTITDKVSASIRRLTGLDIDVTVRSLEELQSLLEAVEERHTFVYFLIDSGIATPIDDPRVTHQTERHLLVAWNGPAAELQRLSRQIKVPSTARYARVVREIVRRASG